MWFRRKQRNRRLSREHVLDVRLRSSVVRAARARMVAITLGVSFAVVVGVYLLWCAGQWGLNALLYENKAFALRRIEAQTDGVISLDQLRRWSQVKPGVNLLALDLAEVKRNLEYVPFVGSAAVERVLPDTLRLRVTERERVAQVTLPRPRPGGGLEMAVYHFDPEGFVMTPLDPRQCSTPLFQPETPLPVISGMNPLDVQAGRRVESPALQAALQLIGAFESSPMLGLVDLRRIDVSAPDVLVVMTGQGSEVTFGLRDLNRQLLRWREIHDAGTRTGRVLASLDLAVSNNLPARWLEASAVPVAPPKPTKLSRPKKKHV